MTLKLADYTAVTTDTFDIRHYGRKGMKWGVITSRKSSSTSDKADTASDEGTKATSSEPRQVVGAASGESSPERYARLASEAKSGNAGNMTEQDLKFFNARTEALSKIAKMNEQKPGFLEDAVRTVAQQTFKNALQSVATAGANKLIENALGIKDGKIKEKAKSVETTAASIKTVATAATKSTSPGSLKKIGKDGADKLVAQVMAERAAAVSDVVKDTSRGVPFVKTAPNAMAVVDGTPDMTPQARVAALWAQPTIQPQVVPNDLFYKILDGFKK